MESCNLYQQGRLQQQRCLDHHGSKAKAVMPTKEGTAAMAKRLAPRAAPTDTPATAGDDINSKEVSMSRKAKNTKEAGNSIDSRDIGDFVLALAAARAEALTDSWVNATTRTLQQQEWNTNNSRNARSIKNCQQQQGIHQQQGCSSNSMQATRGKSATTEATAKAETLSASHTLRLQRKGMFFIFLEKKTMIFLFIKC